MKRKLTFLALLVSFGSIGLSGCGEGFLAGFRGAEAIEAAAEARALAARNAGEAAEATALVNGATGYEAVQQRALAEYAVAPEQFSGTMAQTDRVFGEFGETLAREDQLELADAIVARDGIHARNLRRGVAAGVAAGAVGGGAIGAVGGYQVIKVSAEERLKACHKAVDNWGEAIKDGKGADEAEIEVHRICEPKN